MRPAKFKRDEDLFDVYLILRFHPDRKALVESLADMKKDEHLKACRENICEYLVEVSSPGYLILRSFLRDWVEETAINDDRQNVFSEIITLIR